MSCLIYFVLAVIILIVLLLVIPVGIQFTYDTGMSLFVKVWIFRFRIQGGRKSRKKSGDNDAEKTDISGKIQKLYSKKQEIYELVRFAAGKCVVIRDLDFKLDFGCGDAALTGISTGGLNAFVYGIMSVVHHSTTLKKWNVAINPDFEKTCFEVRINCICTSRLVHIIRIFRRVLSVVGHRKDR